MASSLNARDLLVVTAWFNSSEYNAGPKELLKASTTVDMRIFEDAHPGS